MLPVPISEGYPLFYRRDRSTRSHVAVGLKRVTAGACLVLCAATASAADFTVAASGVVPGPGAIRFALYRGPDGFRHEDRAYRILSAPADKALVTVRFQDLPPGRYAVMAYHDANDNKKLDLRFGMFPKEGWGLSNNPKIMGPPSFGPSAVTVTEPTTTTDIAIHY
ncbi:DUF2141 domain-containing protein [Sphingomonas sp. MMS24-J13]|uniref:DUF2141 domain-containing protein n=1 Tax=Sphingomonas sp. MMS24-J13 TaxID=3238686 RepID=UPI00384C33C6